MDQTDLTETPAKLSSIEKDFIGDVLKLISGSFIVQGISLVLSPVMTRLFSPENFGVSAVFTSIYAILAVITCLRYEATIVIAKTKEESANMLGVCMFFASLTTLVFFPILYFLRYWLADVFQSPELVNLIWLAPLTALTSGTFLALYNWNTRNRKYIHLSAASVAQEVVMDGTRLGFGFSGLASGTTLIISNILGSLTSSSGLAISIFIKEWAFLKNNITWQGMINGIKKFKKFPLYTTWTALINIFALQITTLLLAVFFSTSVTGFYSMGNRIIRLPITMVANIISQVFFQRAAQAKHDGNIAGLVESTFERLITYGLFPMLLLSIAGKELFILVLGARWAEAGVYSQILSIWTFFVFITTPCTHLANIYEKQEVNLALNVVIFVTRAGSLLIGGLLHDIRLTLILFSASGSLVMAWFFFWSIKITGAPAFRIFSRLGKHFLFSIPFLGIISAAIWVYHASPLIITLLSAAVGLVYYAIVFLRDQMLRQVVFSKAGVFLKKWTRSGKK
jgi:O-antigen/teichoic acid export membrane protein